ncbi:MAG TPA: oligopeptide/dipeptide ABC transporter ATP-binding protein, partial [Acidimicrobiales bacterium]|nr:oligopeptide/dipeptide ABC transporter ATP-binding protein [Acidimicrobiales bacterium]
PAGCPFSPRCPYAQDKCHKEKPPLVEAEPGHSYACWYPLTTAGQPQPATAAATSAGTAGAGAGAEEATA